MGEGRNNFSKNQVQTFSGETQGRRAPQIQGLSRPTSTATAALAILTAFAVQSAAMAIDPQAVFCPHIYDGDPLHQTI